MGRFPSIGVTADNRDRRVMFPTFGTDHGRACSRRMDGTGTEQGEGPRTPQDQSDMDPDLARRLVERGFYLIGAKRAPSGAGGGDPGAGG